MSRSSLDIGSSPQSNSAPWLFSDPYAYQYADIPDHIRLIRDARQQPRSVEGKKTTAAATVEAGSVPVFEMEGSSALGVAMVRPTVRVGKEKREGDSGARFELEGCSGRDGNGGGAKGLAKLTITPPGATTTTKISPGTPGGHSAVAASPLTPGCLQVGGHGIKSPLRSIQGGRDAGIELFLAPTDDSSTPSTPTAAGNGLPRRGATYRRPDLVTDKRTSMAIPAVTVTVPEVRRVSPPPPYSSVAPPSTPATPSTRTHHHHYPQHQHYPYQPEPPTPLSALPPHLRYHHQHKRQSHSMPSSPISPIRAPTPPSRTTSPAPASDLDSILRGIDDDRRRARESVLLGERRGGSRGSRAYAKYCDNMG